MQQSGMPGGFFLLFGLIRFIPYIAIAFLVIAIAMWVIFGIKKYRWAKTTGITVTVFAIIFGALSVFTLFTGKMMPGQGMRPPDGFRQDFQNSNQGDYQPPNSKDYNGGQSGGGIPIKLYP
jgi:hypothetical protein